MKWLNKIIKLNIEEFTVRDLIERNLYRPGYFRLFTKMKYLFSTGIKRLPTISSMSKCNYYTARVWSIDIKKAKKDLFGNLIEV